MTAAQELALAYAAVRDAELMERGASEVLADKRRDREVAQVKLEQIIKGSVNRGSE